MKLYGQFFLMHLKSQMQYKVSFSLTVLGQFIVSFTSFLSIYFMFLRFYAVQGFSFEEVLICFAVVLMAYSLAEMLGRGFDQFPKMISNGEFDRVLVRPLGVIFQVLASKIDFSRIGRLTQAVIVLCYAIPNSGIVWTADKIFTITLMIVCGSFVFFALFLIYAAFSFFTIEGLEFMNVFTDGGRELGRYPLSIYGKHILRFFTFIVPVALFQYYPLLYLLGREESQFFMFTPLLALLFVAPAYIFFRIGLRHYKSTGS